MQSKEDAVDAVEGRGRQVQIVSTYVSTKSLLMAYSFCLLMASKLGAGAVGGKGAPAVALVSWS
jgi:hypothetical protein